MRIRVARLQRFEDSGGWGYKGRHPKEDDGGGVEDMAMRMVKVNKG